MYMFILILLMPMCHAWNGIVEVSVASAGGIQLMCPNTPNYVSYAASFAIPLRMQMAAVNLNGMVYFTGGHTGSLPSVVAIVSKFDPVTNTTITVGPMQTVRYGHDATVLQGTIIVCGGLDATGTQLASCERSNSTVTTWSYITSLPVAGIVTLSLVTLANSVYAIGGDSPSGPLATVYMWDGVTAWVSKTSLPDTRIMHNALALNTVAALVCGGQVAGVASASCTVYNAFTDTWTPVADMNVTRIFHGLVMSEGVCVCALQFT
jgi:hypothetical protein